MIACPLCEHLQPDGDACDVCGRALERPAGADAPVPLLDGLEPTALADAGAPAVAPLEGLEPTVRAPDGPGAADPATPEPFLEIEPTRAAAVEVAADPVPDLEQTATGIPGDAPTLLAAVPTCRYCRTPALPGERRCARCGMRLPVTANARAAGAAEGPEVRLCSCGAPVTGSVCPACGARIPGSLEG